MKTNQTVDASGAYFRAVVDLRKLLANIGRHEFRAYGYAKQLRAYRARLK
jgi:hypothetical protein